MKDVRKNARRCARLRHRRKTGAHRRWLPFAWRPSARQWESESRMCAMASRASRRTRVVRFFAAVAIGNACDVVATQLHGLKNSRADDRQARNRERKTDKTSQARANG